MNLSAKFIISVTALITLIMIGVIFSIMTREKAIIVQEMQKKGHTIAEVLAMSSINSFLDHDYSTLKRYIDTIAKDEDVKYVMILNLSGVVKMHNDPDMLGKVLNDPLTINSLKTKDPINQLYRLNLKEDVYDIAAPIMTEERRLGIVRIGISTKKMYSEITESRNRIIFMGIVAILVGITGSIIMARTISKPIKKLVKSAQAISQGNLDLKLDVTSRDEVGILTEAFRNMAGKLSRHINELIRTERLAVMGKIGANIAHEVKNPLDAIKGSAEYLQKKYHEDKTITKFTTIIKDEINEVAQFLDEYLQFARPTTPQFAPININSVIDETLVLTENLIEQHYIKVNKELKTDLPLLLADSIQLKQVFMNIILNAIEAMPSGGDLTIRTFKEIHPEEDRGKGGPAGEKIVVEFSDIGKGIPRENIEKIFDPFYTTKEEGSGLGLSISLSIIEKHKGRIVVTSEEGKGSVFRVNLPVCVPGKD